MKWESGTSLNGRFIAFAIYGLFAICLIASASGCATQEQIRKATQQTAMNTKALVDIEAKKHPENEGIKEVIAALKKGLGDIEKPEPYKIPDWVKIAAGILGILLFPTATKLTLDAGKSGAGMIGKIVGAISNKKGKGKS